jgi:hypothetical protein
MEASNGESYYARGVQQAARISRRATASSGDVLSCHRALMVVQARAYQNIGGSAVGDVGVAGRPPRAQFRAQRAPIRRTARLPNPPDALISFGK